MDELLDTLLDLDRVFRVDGALGIPESAFTDGAVGDGDSEDDGLGAGSEPRSPVKRARSTNVTRERPPEGTEASNHPDACPDTCAACTPGSALAVPPFSAIRGAVPATPVPQLAEAADRYTRVAVVLRAIGMHVARGGDDGAAAAEFDAVEAPVGSVWAYDCSPGDRELCRRATPRTHARPTSPSTICCARVGSERSR